MEKPSEFQIKYPLSPKKFTKKMIQKIWPILTTSLALALLFMYLGIFLVLDTAAENPHTIGTYIALLVGAFIASIAVMSIIYAAYLKAYIRRYYYDCDPSFITIKKGVFAPTEIHVMYQKIQDVYVDQDILDRMLGIYDVHIASATAASGIEAHIDGVDFSVAESLKHIILDKIKGGPAVPATNISAAVSSSPTVTEKPIQFSGNVSSKNFPISGSWIWQSALQNLRTSLIIVGGFLVWLGGYDYLLYFIAAFIILFLIIMIGTIIWQSNFYFEFMPDFVLLKTGIIGRQEKHLPYKSIQDVSTKQSVIERMMGMATVVIKNASSGGDSKFSGIFLVGQPYSRALELTKVINEIVISRKDSGQMGL